MEFAGNSAGYSTEDVPLPIIVYTSSRDIRRFFLGLDAGGGAKQEPGILQYKGSYDGKRMMMLLNIKVDYTDPNNEHIIVHEFVHHLQFWHNDADEYCSGRDEPAAYQALAECVDNTGYGVKANPLIPIMAVQMCYEGER
jgi:hypothetical protein